MKYKGADNPKFKYDDFVNDFESCSLSPYTEIIFRKSDGHTFKRYVKDLPYMGDNARHMPIGVFKF